MGRWWVYQRERFPLAAHMPLVLAFSFSAVSFSAVLRGASPSLAGVAVAFVSSLLFFLELRIADEFKDAEDDARFRPYRPVPRGLVTLRELGWLFAGAAAVQAALAIAFYPPLLVLLCVTWLYLALMTKEFFVSGWLKAHPVAYMWSHMLILPLIDLYVTATDWMPAGGKPHTGLAWFLVLSFFNGMVLEIGRKLRAPSDEETGVETYTFLWGRTRAVAAWLAAMGATLVAGAMAAQAVGFAVPVVVLLGAALLAAAGLGMRFLGSPVSARSRWLEPASGVWTLLLYLSVGAAPLLMRL